MPNRVFYFALALLGFANAMPAHPCQQNQMAWQSWIGRGEPYSVAVCDGSDPLKRYREVSSTLLQVTANHG